MAPKKILCPTDFSELSKFALRYATDFALLSNAKITVMNVTDNFFGVEPTSGVYTDSLVTFSSELALLRDEIRDLNTSILSTHHCLGNPANEISKFAEKEKFDLILLGSHGRSGLKKLFLGSVAQQVIKKARTNVLIVKSGGRSERVFSDLRKSTIVVPYDFTDGCDNAIEYAMSIADERLQIKAINVAEPVELKNVPGSARLTRENEICSGNRSEFFARTGIDQNGRVKFRTVFDMDIATRICQFSNQVNAKMIVMPFRKKGFFERMVLGSTTQAVTQRACCPLLVIKELDSFAEDETTHDKFDTRSDQNNEIDSV